MVSVKPRFLSTFLSVFGSLVLSVAVLTPCWASEEPSRWQFGLAIGAGIRTNPVMDNDDIPLLVLPQISYEGERFFIQNLDVGYAISQSEEQTLNLLLTPSYDQIFFNEWDAVNFIDQSNFASISGGAKDSPSLGVESRAIDKSRLHDRRMSALAGVEFSRRVLDLDIQLQALHEVTGNYDGNEIRLALMKAIPAGKHELKFTAGLNWQSQETNNYFYGLSEKDSSVAFTYRPTAGVSSLFRFDWSYQLSDKWSLKFFTSYRHLSHSISDSPLITENNVITAFAGGVYHF